MQVNGKILELLLIYFRMDNNNSSENQQAAGTSQRARILSDSSTSSDGSTGTNTSIMEVTAALEMTCGITQKEGGKMEVDPQPPTTATPTGTDGANPGTVPSMRSRDEQLEQEDLQE